jgi:putative phosphoesterase
MSSFKIAVISDIHANLSALRAVLSDIHNEGIKRIFCLGDLVGYYTQPIPTIHLSLAKCEVVIKGNHDNSAALGEIPDHYRSDSLLPIEFTNQSLTVYERKILHALPLMHKEECNKVKKKMMFIHGGPEYPLDQYIYPDMNDEIKGCFDFMELINVNALFMGHTHIPFKAEMNGKLICNPGSVGQPRDGDSRASYLFYDMENHNVEFRRVQYDPTATINGVKKHNFSSELGERLLVGK